MPVAVSVGCIKFKCVLQEQNFSNFFVFILVWFLLFQENKLSSKEIWMRLRQFSLLFSRHGTIAVVLQVSWNPNYKNICHNCVSCGLPA